MTRLRIAEGLRIPEDAVTQTFAILAKRGVGKTYTAAVMTEELLKAGLQVVVVDPIGVWYGLRAAANGKDPGLPIIVMGGDHGDVPLEVGAGKVIAEFVVEQRQSVVLDLSILRKGDQVRFMTDFAETLYHRNREPLHLVLDEADAFAPQRPYKGQERLLGAVEDLVRRGRARGIGVTLVTQRAAVLNKDVLTQAEVLVALRTIAPQDRDAIDAWIKVHGTPAQREDLMTSLPSLPIGTAWFWSPGWLDLFKRVEVRRRETFDSSATPKAGAKPKAPKRMADVDLDALKGRIASTIERAKNEDPRELRKRIAALEVELRNRKLPPAQKEVAKRVEVPVLKDAQIKRVEAIVERLEKLRFALGAAAGDLHAHAQALLVALRKTMAPASATMTHAPPPRLQTSARPPAAPPRRSPSAPARATNGGLGAGERQVLTAVAQHQLGVTREQLTILTGYKRSTRNLYVQRLRSAELITYIGERIVATDAATRELGPDFEPLPTGEALREYWLARLPEGERKILGVLVKAYPEAVDRESISETTGYLRSTRNLYLQRLRARELIESDANSVRASETLFQQ